MALIVIATGLSSVMDGRTAKAKIKAEIEKQIDENQSTLVDLRDRLDAANFKLAPLAGRKNLDAPCEERKKAVAENAEKIDKLSVRKAELASTVGKTGLAFAKYREDYRNMVWYGAVGETHGKLVTVDGKEYNQVTISKVTQNGLEIRHEYGGARISPSQLPLDWQHRFQWNPAVALMSVD